MILLGVLDDRWIDIEHHRHLARLARFKALLRKAEAVDLVEIGADRRRRDVVGHLPGGAFGNLRGARKSSRTAEPVVQRHRRERRTDHASDKDAAGAGDQYVAV